MSRIGKAEIPIPSGVKIELKEDRVRVEGSGGKLEQYIHPRIKVEINDGKIKLNRASDSADDKALHGLFQRLIANMVKGVTKGFEKNLEIQGVGYRGKVEGKGLVLQLGFSHLVKHQIPEGITIAVTENTKINIKGADRRLVGQIAADIRRILPPEPYKGKGIRYLGEHVRRKAGKAVVAKGAAGGAAGGK